MQNATSVITTEGEEPFVCLCDDDAARFMGVELSTVINAHKSNEHRIHGEKPFKIIWFNVK